VAAVASIDELMDAPPEEAARVFRRFADGAPARAESFAEEIEAAGGPVLDYTVESLEVLWAWVLDRIVPRRRLFGRPRDLRPHERPFWLEGEERLSPETAHLADGVATYAGEVAKRARPGSGWFMLDDGGRSYDHQSPVMGTHERMVPLLTLVRNAFVLAIEDPARRDTDQLDIVLAPLTGRRRRIRHGQ
jgi:hypothetical protein